MVGAGLLVGSLENLKNFYPDFNKLDVVLLSVDARLIGYHDNQLVPLCQPLLDVDPMAALRRG